LVTATLYVVCHSILIVFVVKTFLRQ